MPAGPLRDEPPVRRKTGAVTEIGLTPDRSSAYAVATDSLQLCKVPVIFLTVPLIHSASNEPHRPPVTWITYATMHRCDDCLVHSPGPGIAPIGGPETIMRQSNPFPPRSRFDGSEIKEYQRVQVFSALLLAAISGASLGQMMGGPMSTSQYFPLVDGARYDYMYTSGPWATSTATMHAGQTWAGSPD